MKQRLFLIALILISFQKNYACICRGGKLPFRSTAQYADFVALIKILSYDYVENPTLDNKDRKPSAINVEVIKKYKGKENRKRIKIWGNNGSSCWVNINSFKVGHYYLVAPYNLGIQATKVQQSQDYAFSFCNVNALSVKYDTQKAYGKYSKTKQAISLEQFEKDLGIRK